jgi:anaerobic magnesium-protoporphyrin IX monomethyl ester cyclase
MTAVPRDNAILLASSYYLTYDEKQMRKMKPYPPLGTIITAAVVREQGFAVELFDAMLSPGVEEFLQTIDRVQPRIVGIVEDNFNFLTKMCTVRMREAALDMIRGAKERGCRVAVNGSDASDHPELYLAAGADAVVAGAVELTFTELVQTWSADPDAPLEDVAGLVLTAHPAQNGNGTNGHHLHRTAPHARIEDLDKLPLPAWDLVDAERYRAAWTRAHGKLSFNMTTARGCPYKCNWCAKPVFGTRYAQRSAARVAEELRLLRDTAKPDHIWFTDDIFGLTAAWIEQFSHEVNARGARTPFMMQSRVNLMKPDVVAALAAAGAEEVWLGVESGSQRILDAMDKGTRIEQVRSATRTLRAHAIRSGWFIQLGYLGETWEDILMTRDLIREECPDDIGVSVSYPLPGTVFYEKVKAQLGSKQNWVHSDDLAMMFKGTYTTDFYRQLRDLLHDEARVWVSAGPAARAALDARWAELAARESDFRSSAPSLNSVV